MLLFGVIQVDLTVTDLAFLKAYCGTIASYVEQMKTVTMNARVRFN